MTLTTLKLSSYADFQNDSHLSNSPTAALTDHGVFTCAMQWKDDSVRSDIATGESQIQQQKFGDRGFSSVRTSACT